jgi:Bacterial Ig-like domain (group 2)
MSLMNGNVVRSCLGLLSVWVLASCGGSSSPATPAPPPSPTLTSIALSPLTASLPASGTQQLTVTGTYSNSTTAVLPASGETFASSNTAVASVSAAGLVTVAAGAAANQTATISATDTASGLATSAANSTVITVAPPPVGPTANSVAAAKATAANNAECKAPNITNAFYWEIGDKSGALVTGIQPSSTGTTLDPQGNQISASTSLWSVASASKWIYASYVVEVRTAATIKAQTSTSGDIPYLNFTSGWVFLGNYPPTSNTCTLIDTVDQCIAGIPATPVAPDASAVGAFWYDDDHMEQHASAVMGLGAQGIGDLSTTILAVLGVNLNFSYSIPILAAGVYTTSDDYASFLRNILNGTYQMSQTLSAFPVCTNSTVAGCNAVAGQSPIAAASSNAEAWHYSLGHWIENDPTVGDGSFSSPGALGFYPWIDKDSTYYGLLVREDDSAKTSGAYEGYQSAVCGRLIRQAWMSGVEQTAPAPVFTQARSASPAPAVR